MTTREVQKAVAGLRERFHAPYDLADRSLIERLYLEVFGQRLRHGCQNCYHDAVIELNTYTKRNIPMASQKKYVLKAGAVIQSPAFEKGAIFTNKNLTDKIAAKYLKKFPNRAGLFAVVPAKEEPAAEEVKEETAAEETTDKE